jgi:uncharacterized protein (TIGR02301 family)
MGRVAFSFGTRGAAGAMLALLLAFAPVPAQAANLHDGLIRLSEILGSIHHLREICGANDGPLWRNKMIDMMNAAALREKERKVLISHFNDAYYDARTRFPICTRGATRRANTLFDEGYRLAKGLSRGDMNAAALHW